MRRFLALLVLLLLLVLPVQLLAQHGGHSHSGSSRSSTSTGKVHVRGYYRKDGTYVQPYERSYPGTASATHSSGYSPSSGSSATAGVARDSNGRIKRSKAARSAFMRQQPCPSTGKTSGSCPGYVVDHVRPLECRGADDPSNMQWQTTAAAKTKDKTEGSCR
jgi:hypothetical protein